MMNTTSPSSKNFDYDISNMPNIGVKLDYAKPIKSNGQVIQKIEEEDIQYEIEFFGDIQHLGRKSSFSYNGRKPKADIGCQCYRQGIALGLMYLYC